MASNSNSSSSSKLVTLPLIVLVFFISPAHTSKTLGRSHPTPKTGFKVPLRRVHRGENLTKIEYLQRAVNRRKHKLEKLNEGIPIQSQVSPGDGEFEMQLAIGTPPSSYPLVLDTGSDLIWTQCSPFVDDLDLYFDPMKSSSFSTLPCSSRFCQALDIPQCGPNGCQYLYLYVDLTSTHGVLATKTFSFGDVSHRDIVFGCGKYESEQGYNNIMGLMGMGRRPLSLVSQVNATIFSYCLTSLDDESSTSTLYIDSLPNIDNVGTRTKTLTTPFLKNPFGRPWYYYVKLEAITVGDVTIPIKETGVWIGEDEGGGDNNMNMMIIDSGTTITYLTHRIFKAVADEFGSQINLAAYDSESPVLDACYVLPFDSGVLEVPKLIFHFDGGVLDPPLENYVVWDHYMICLAMGISDDETMIFGNIQQQNMLMVYDIEQESLSITPTQCDKL